ncbi:MAG: VanW family protein [Coriobacteriia bacterium]|nr:VanW family protein [Coriobacteriia bacterium]
MTDSKEKTFLQKLAKSGVVIVLPLLFVCCFVIAGFMVASYSGNLQMYHNTGAQQGGANGQHANEGDPSYGAANGSEDNAVIGEHVAVSTNEEAGRNENLRLAAESLNGTIIEAGNTFSFNEVVGDVQNDDRYQLAPVARDDQIVPGRGGGISQVATALYMAALIANLAIDERHAHDTTIIDYVELGLDAAVEYGAMDLRITNSTYQPVTIQASAADSAVTVSLIGEAFLEEEHEIIPSSTTISYHRAGTGLPSDMEFDEVMFNSTFYMVESFREYHYRGSVVDTQFLSRDTYMVLEGSIVRLPTGGNHDAIK